jgi:hypothetical protein
LGVNDIIGFRRNAGTVLKRRIVVFIILFVSLLSELSFARSGDHRSGGHASGSYSHFPAATGIRQAIIAGTLNLPPPKSMYFEAPVLPKRGKADKIIGGFT